MGHKSILYLSKSSCISALNFLLSELHVEAKIIKFSFLEINDNILFLMS